MAGTSFWCGDICWMFLLGTLGYVMSEVEDGKLLSQVVRAAKSLGYTEPGEWLCYVGDCILNMCSLWIFLFISIHKKINMIIIVYDMVIICLSTLHIFGTCAKIDGSNPLTSSH